MIWNKLSAWFLTEAGRKFSYLAVGTATSGVLLGHILPHTIFLDKYQDLFRLYKNGFAVPLPDLLQKRFQKTLDLLEIDNEDRHLFKAFPASGFDIFSLGSSLSKYGVAVGIPANFFYETVSSVDKNLIKLGGEQIVWDLEEGQMLLKSLVMSENAQIYAMAREIKYRETPKPLYDAVISVLSCTGMYGLCNSLNTKWNLYVKPTAVRVILYCIVGAFTFGSYALCKDMAQVYFEGKIDSELKGKHQVFAEGGKEFYSKLLQRNIALRKLLGKEGERAYSILGNENYFIRCKHIPLAHRKMFFDEPVQLQ